jgi:NTP pyrophosphatase (non-canonical NTP hydrolase)
MNKRDKMEEVIEVVDWIKRYENREMFKKYE